jgi:hypothetical protein
MKKIPLLIVVSLTHLIVSAQYQTKPLSLKDYIQVTLQDETAPQSMADKFSSVDVIDARDDSSSIGFYYREKGHYYEDYNEKDWNKYYRIIPSARQSIDTWTANYLHITEHSSAENTLLVVVKKLWISSEAAPSLFMTDKKGQPSQGFDAGVVSKLEFYLGKDAIYYPLYRFDSVLAFTEKLPQSSGYFITETLKKSLDKLFSLNLSGVYQKKITLSFEEIVLSNKQNIILPVLTDTILKRGVYINFEEFKMNAPSLKEYEFRKGKFGDILYVKKKGTEYPERNAWGFCDGKDCFINSTDKYSKLIKEQSSFYFAGIKGLTIKTRRRRPVIHVFENPVFPIYPTLGHKYISHDKILKYYIVDMETGEVY